jgi:hypothetical protein
LDEAVTISQLPNEPAVYALYGGRGRSVHAAYVGVTDKLRQRITQHLVRRDSSVVTGVSVVSLDPDLVSEVRWWLHPSFNDPAHVMAAELIAFDILEPILRSRGAVDGRAGVLAADEAFAAPMQALFGGEPTGRLVIPTLADAMERIAALERRLTALETKFLDR